VNSSLALERFGDLGGIVLNRRTGHLVGGHQRIDAFKEQRIAAVIERELEKPDPTGTLAYGHIEMFGTRYAYREVDWDEKVELAANLAANRHGGEFDWPAVSAILSSIQDTDEMQLTGFSDDEMQNLLGAAEWRPEDVEDFTQQQGRDSVHLSPNAREALNQCKERLHKESDSETIEEVCVNWLILNSPKPVTV